MVTFCCICSQNKSKFQLLKHNHLYTKQDQELKCIILCHHQTKPTEYEATTDSARQEAKLLTCIYSLTPITTGHPKHQIGNRDGCMKKKQRCNIKQQHPKCQKCPHCTKDQFYPAIMLGMQQNLVDFPENFKP